jgi:hypothetical protein
MAGSSRWLGVLAVLGLVISPAGAQVTIGTVTGNPVGTFTCNATVTAAQPLQEGYTELLGDIVITCTGGTLLPAGAQIPQTNITVSASVPLTSRLFDSDSHLSEALLLIDEPGSRLRPTCFPIALLLQVRLCRIRERDWGDNCAG